MSMTPKTIQIFLPGGDPQGIRVAEITTRIVQVIEVPRSLLSEFLKMPESDQVALYFLVAESDEDAEPKAYIGQTSDLRLRLSTHNKKKEFWQRALILISRTNSLTQTHALFLEWHCLQQCKAAGRYVEENGNSGSRPHTPAPLEADCYEIYETGKTLLATLGFPIFDPVVKTLTPSKSDELFYCKSSGANGRGLYTQEGFVVLKGSFGRKENVPSITGTADEKFRQKLVESGILKEQGDTLVFEKDHLFKSPSMAAVALMGRTSNGWIDWKSQDGKTLDELKRQTVVEDD
jgi:predicted GIY-YIG superfamily endonuclease